MRFSVRIIAALTLTLTLLGHANAVPAQGQKIMVSGPSPYSVAIVKRVHRAGGNVVDAAVAAAIGLAVTTPYYAAFGGGGFALIKIGKDVSVLDFRETAPANMNPQTYIDKPMNASLDGGMAVGIPGVPAGLWEMHQKHGKLKWSRLFDEAINMAQFGFEVSGEWSKQTADNKARVNKDALSIFYPKRPADLGPGEVFKQPRL
ncbi:MAG: gamma-glutamyltransferase, partial [Bdellovibrionota bacterium]